MAKAVKRRMTGWIGKDSMFQMMICIGQYVGIVKGVESLCGALNVAMVRKSK